MLLKVIKNTLYKSTKEGMARWITSHRALRDRRYKMKKVEAKLTNGNDREIELSIGDQSTRSDVFHERMPDGKLTGYDRVVFSISLGKFGIGEGEIDWYTEEIQQTCWDNCDQDIDHSLLITVHYN